MLAACVLGRAEPAAAQAGWEPDRAPTGAGVSARSYVLTPDIVTDETGRTVAVERGLVFVPENRRVPSSRLIAVHFVRFPALQSGEAGRAPVFLLPGGPGWGFDLSDPLVFDEVARLRRTRAVVVVSQRGYDGAPGLVPEFRVRYDAVPVDSLTPALTRARRDSATLAAAFARWRGLGVDVTGYDIHNITDDLHDLRAALGYDKVVLRGCSFGSQWALAYLKRWPATVDRAFLSGVEPLDYGYDSPEALWASMARVARAAEADPDVAPHVPAGGIMRALQTVIARLEARPASVRIRWQGADTVVPVGVDDLRGVLTGLALNRRRGLENLAQWPRFVLELYQGDHRFLAARAAEERARRRSESLILPLINHSVGVSAARASRLRAEPAARWLGDVNVRERVARSAATTLEVDDRFRADSRIAVPTLLVAGDYDWSTPVENAEHLAGLLDAGHLVRVRGGRHCTETNHDELPAQWPDALAQLYGFLDAEFAGSSPRAFFGTLPGELRLAPLDFAPPAGRSLYEEWLARRN
jgi:pimeloyl-ACP methyl ester carboxylesterase